VPPSTTVGQGNNLSRTADRTRRCQVHVSVGVAATRQVVSGRNRLGVYQTPVLACIFYAAAETASVTLHDRVVSANSSTQTFLMRASICGLDVNL
jgi:hypothetical protein